ncbi:diacylglycerol/lipid kinase family protein [Enterococcus sp. LJL90]
MNFHYHLLINPAAGSGTGANAAKKIVTLLEKNHFLHSVYRTENIGDEKIIAAELAETTLKPWHDDLQNSEEVYPLLVIVGGDGTLHGVLNQFYLLGKKFPVAYLPAGSGNDLARAIGLPKEIEKAFWQIVNAPSPKEMHVITYDEQVKNQQGLVFNNFGIGLEASIVATTNDSAAKKNLNKYHMGSFSYIFSILKVLFTQKGYPILIESNGQEYSFDNAFLCTTTNHPYFGGGVPIAPMASVEQDSFETIVVERIALFKIFWLIILLVQKKHTKSKYFHHFNGRKLRLISTVPEFAQTDGEVLEPQPFDVSFQLDKQLLWY